MAERAGPNMERHRTAFGTEVFLPVGCELQPNYLVNGTDQEKAAWHEAQKDRPPFATDRDS